MKLKIIFILCLLAPALCSCLATGGQPVAREFAVEEASIGEIQAAFDAGTLSSAALVQGYLDRIAAYEDAGPRINAMITVHPDALAQAAAADAERPRLVSRSPLHGIPVVLKDNIDTYDLPTSNGSALLAEALPPDDATLVRKLREAGAIILGKAAMGEFASGSYNSVSGQTINPYHLKRDTGGSSSGSGAAIAANFAVLAVGTDTSTSVRGPSAYTGIVGLRPTTGLISRDGIAPKNLEFDTAGPMARTVTDVAHMLSVIAVPDIEDSLSLPVWDEVARRYEMVNGHIDYTRFLDAGSLEGVRVGVLRDFFGGDPEIDELAEAALDKLEELGAVLVDIRLPADFMERYTEEGSSYIRRTADYRFRADWEAYAATLQGAPKTVAEMIGLYETVVNQSPLPARDNTMRLLRDSLTKSTADPAYQELVKEVLPRATADKLAVFERHGVQVLVFPYETSFAGVISNPVYELDDPGYRRSEVPSPATLAGYNSTGFPSMVVPMGFGSAGLPMNLGFMARPYEEGPLLGYAYAYEQASRMRRPSPLVPPLAE